jgi:hypothetical protein
VPLLFSSITCTRTGAAYFNIATSMEHISGQYDGKAASPKRLMSSGTLRRHVVL